MHAVLNLIVYARRNQLVIQAYPLDIEIGNVKYLVVNGLPGICPSRGSSHAITLCHSRGDTRAGRQRCDPLRGSSALSSLETQLFLANNLRIIQREYKSNNQFARLINASNSCRQDDLSKRTSRARSEF